MYFHERLLQRALGNGNFRLPVWDWESDSKVPPAYKGWFKVPGVDCEYARAPGVDGINATTLRNWLLSDSFDDFGGDPYNSGNAQNGIHQLVHGALGGYMTISDVAAMDPLFYAHHVNVDRYWCGWTKHYGTAPPFDPKWPTEPFVFYDVDQGLVSVHAEQLLNTKDWGYEYDVPDIPVFVFTTINAQSRGNLLSIDPRAILPLLLEIAQIAGLPVPLAALREDPFLQVLALLAAIVKQFPLAPFPFDIRMTVPLIDPSRKYGIALTANGNTKVIGAFGVFGGGHAHQPTEIATQISVTISALSALTGIFTTAGAAMTYGILSPDGLQLENPQSPAVQRAEIRYPTEAPDLKKLLGI